MLFFLTWPDRASVLIDMANESEARAAAREVAEDDEPATCVAFDRLFVAEVFLDEDDAGDPMLVVEPLSHVAEALAALEEQGEEVAEVPVTCAFELEDDDGTILRCEREPHDDARHEAHDAQGQLAEWDDDGSSG